MLQPAGTTEPLIWPDSASHGTTRVGVVDKHIARIGTKWFNDHAREPFRIRAYAPRPEGDHTRQIEQLAGDLGLWLGAQLSGRAFRDRGIAWHHGR